MKIYSITDPLFAEYGQVTEGVCAEELLKKLDETVPMPPAGEFVYCAEEMSLSRSPEGKQLGETLYGGLPGQLGYSIGYNSVLDCLEYHRDSEFSISTEDFIMMLAKRSEMHDFMIDSSCVKAFLIPANTMVEIYATALHYKPCNVEPGKGYKILVILPAGTNTPYTPQSKSAEDAYLRARNKYLIAHKDAPEAAEGARIGITGENLDLARTGMEFI